MGFAKHSTRVLRNILKAPPSPVSGGFAAIPNLGDPRLLVGFPATINPTAPYPAILQLATAAPQTLISAGMFSLSILRMADQSVHRWNWDADGAGVSSAIDVTQAIQTEPVQVDFPTWSSMYDEANNGPLDDLDGDGVPNVVKFALGGNPLDGRPSTSMQVTRNATNTTVDVLVPTYHVGAVVTVEVSSNLASWADSGVLPQISAAGPAGRLLRWTLAGTGSAAFVRLRVTIP